MADQYFAASEAINLGAATALVTLDVASTSGVRRMNLNELSVSFNGTSSTASPVTVRLVRTTVAPVGGGTITQASTPTDGSNSAGSTFTAYMPTTATPGVYATTAPTVGVILRTWLVSPTSGLVIQFPLGQEPTSPATSGAGLGIQCVAPAAVAVSTSLTWTE